MKYEKLTGRGLDELSTAIQTRVEAARQAQQALFSNADRMACNANMRPVEVRLVCGLNSRWVRQR